MKNTLRLAFASLMSRKTNALLMLLAIAISTMLLLGVERVSQQTRSGFANTISGTDLIVGARSSPVNLLLYSVFHVGNPTNNVSWETFERYKNHDQVTWAVPVSLGDSYRGFNVVATTADYFEHFRYGERTSLSFAQGEAFDLGEVVLGASVARQQGLAFGDEIVVAHGTGSVSFHHHDEHPLHVRGVLAPTGTPVDHALYISLQDLAAMHGEHDHDDQHDAQGKSQPDFSGRTNFSSQKSNEHDEIKHLNTPPASSISAFFLGLHSQPRAIFMQREINTYSGEPLTAIMPGATLQDLWRTMSAFETALTVVSGFVLLTGLLGILATILASLQERRKEMAVLRAIGAGPATIFSLLVLETIVIAIAGVLFGTLLLYGLMFLLAPWAQSAFGIALGFGAISNAEWLRIGLIIGTSLLISCIPAWRAYRNSLTDGLSMRL